MLKNMTQNPKVVENMGFDHLSSNEELEEIGNQNSFVVDVERFSHLIHKKDIKGNSTISRNVSRKGCFRGSNKNIKPTTANQNNGNTLPGSTPEKPVVVTPGSPKLHHHQIVVKNSALISPASENKQFGPRHSPSTWSIDPRRILVFFATLSSLGSILLIYFTLSINSRGTPKVLATLP